MTQSYEKHAHHPVATYIASLFALVAIIAFVGAVMFGWPTRDLVALSLIVAVAVLASISRGYITKLQDRIILLEMKVRGAELLTPDQEAMLARLRPRQVIALRFASDAELADLLERAARENLSPDDIKRAIKEWRPDLLRT